MGTEWQQACATGLFLGLVYALIALGFAITFGVMRIANFAHGEFVIAGMYSMIWLHQDLQVPALLAVPLSALLVAALGMAFERVTVEPIAGHSHFMQMIVTLGGLIILQQLAALVFGDAAKGLKLSYPALDLRLGDAFISGTRVVAAVAALLAMALVLFLLQRTYFGRAVRAVADNRSAAQLMGVDTLRVNLTAFALGAGCAGLAGALIIPFLFVSPYAGLGLTVKSFVVVMIAGSSSMARILAVSIFLGMIESISGVYLSLSLVPAVVYGSLMLVLVIMMARSHRSGSLLSLGEKSVA
jgi:branched-chain amino acid transport system permease protein